MIPVRRWPAELLVAPIRFYQRFITPYTPATCRYYPTCSAYAVTALRTRGAVVGTALTVWRLLRCNPWSEGGIDHVPATGFRGDRSGSGDRERIESDRSSIGGSDGSGAAGDGDGSRPDATPGPVPPPTAGDPADLSSAPPSRSGDSKIGRFAA